MEISQWPLEENTTIPCQKNFHLHLVTDVSFCRIQLSIQFYVLFAFSLFPLEHGNNGQEMGAWLVMKKAGEAKALPADGSPLSWNFTCAWELTPLQVDVPPGAGAAGLPKQRRQKAVLPTVRSAFCMLLSWQEN